jgi:hypothetical protein
VKVLLYQLDGKIPNIALMRIAAHHRELGDEVELRWQGHGRRELWDRGDETVYASIIFERSRPKVSELLTYWPRAICGGSGWDEKATLEAQGIETKRQDYSLYPAYRHSLGFTQRGCRLACSFCAVSRMEGRVREEQTIEELWRGEPWPRELVLLDNDFFGSKLWRQKIDAIKAGKFKVCFNQGINARLGNEVRHLDDEAAAALASVPYYDDQFKTRRIYTAWDNRKDEERLFAGLENLAKHGVKPDQIMVYMLIGFWDGPTLTADDFYRHDRLREFGCRPYPMPFVRTQELVGFQRWVVTRADLKCPWDRYKAAKYRPENVGILATHAPNRPNQPTQ